MRLDRGLYWLKPYLEIAKRIEPDISKITRIKNCTPQKNKAPRCYAQLSYVETYDIYKLSIYSKFRRTERIHPETEYKIISFSKLDILSFLAHELSHIQHWNHTPLRQKLENRFSNLFMDYLIRDGYVSEEDEQKNK